MGNARDWHSEFDTCEACALPLSHIAGKFDVIFCFSHITWTRTSFEYLCCILCMAGYGLCLYTLPQKISCLSLFSLIGEVVLFHITSLEFAV